MLAFYVDFLLTNSRKNIYGTVKIKLLSARGEMSLVLFSQRDDADTFERMACLASVVMKIVDCYIGSILSIGCFLLEWLIRVTCPIAHRCRLPVYLSSSPFLFRFVSFGRSDEVFGFGLSQSCFLILLFEELGARTTRHFSYESCLKKIKSP
jgi:hypothetical protein